MVELTTLSILLSIVLCTLKSVATAAENIYVLIEFKVILISYSKVTTFFLLCRRRVAHSWRVSKGRAVITA